MAEIVLRGVVGIMPRIEGGRQFIVQEPNGDVYRIPLPPDLHAQVAEALNRDDEELAAEVERQRAADLLVLPGQGNDIGQPLGASPNGGGRSA